VQHHGRRPEKTVPRGERHQGRSGRGRLAAVVGRRETLPYPDPALFLPVIEGYQILDEAGRGGMGIVYRARHVESGRLVAIKVIRKDRLVHEESVQRFRREAKAAARLTHPNIVIVYDYDHDGDTHYLVMEFVDGVTLQALVDHDGPLPIAQACDFVRRPT
jgi:serine/threonine protein kinase